LSSGMSPNIFCSLRRAAGPPPSLVRTTFSGPALALQKLVRMIHDPQCRAGRQSRQIQEKAQDYSGFGLSRAVRGRP
jgi:hypothetical protein